MKSELAFPNVLKDNKVFISKRNNYNASLFVVSPVLKFGYVVAVLYASRFTLSALIVLILETTQTLPFRRWFLDIKRSKQNKKSIHQWDLNS